MAKVKHNNLIDTLNTIAEDAKSRGVIQLHTEDESFTGRTIKINGKDLFHFGTTGYLGLEQDQRLKDAAIDAIQKFGTQFPLSKSYVSHSLYQELEEKLNLMFKVPVLVMKNSTLGHMGVIPSIVRDEDAVILDHYVHWSVQNASLLLKNRGVTVDMIRHNNMNMLEEKIKALSPGREKIWYCADGVYSMFGDTAPIEHLKTLCAKYPQLYLYFDDVHGMSWVGENGTGYVLNQYKKLPENVFLFSTLSKSFGASGGILVSSNQSYFNKVKNFGGPLTFSAQLEPASVAAAIASAKIHLSSEITEMQAELRGKIDYCNDLLAQTNLPLVDRNDCPVFYIGAGAPAVGYNFVNKMYDAGFYGNMGIFPAVPVKKTGIRFTISRHNQREDIEQLVAALNENFPKALEEERYSMNSVRKIFELPLIEKDNKVIAKKVQPLSLQTFDSIKDVDAETWDTYFGGEGVFNHAGLQFLEKTFTDNKEKENNWRFFYLLVRDEHKKVIAATFFTFALWKEDMLAPASISKEFEEKRKSEPGFMVSTALIMGSLFTEGQHLFLDKNDDRWQNAMDLIIEKVEELDELLKPSSIVLRDFDESDTEIEEYVLKKGFFKTTLPESCAVEDLSWTNTEEYISTLSSKSRKHFRQDVAPFENYFDIEVKQTLTEDEVCQFMTLYQNVWSKNLDVNTFPFNKSVFEQMSEDTNWEFIVLKLKKEEQGQNEADKPIAVMFCFNNSNTTYVPAFIGMDYDYVQKYQTYRQMLYQTIVRAQSLGFNKINFGYSSSFEKKKLGASIYPRVAFIQAKDNYSIEMMGIIQKK
jgi:7-keto-8-aminopelargonate synthetase-like enzyme/predicted N-acyltransferase